jgi:uncharacterized protein
VAGVSQDAAPSGGLSRAELAEVGTMLFDLARAGDTDALAALVDRGVPVDLRDAGGNSLLMMAAYHGHAGTARALAERGADVDLLNDDGRSPLAGAVFKRHDEVVELLLAQGASPHRGAPSAIVTALAFGRTDTEQLLRGTVASDAGKRE